MLSLRKALLVLGIVALCAAPGMAQGQRGFGQFGGGGGAMLLNNTGVQKELKMTEEQVTKVREAQQEVREKFRDDFARIREATPEERTEIMKKVGDANKEAVSKILKPEQVTRLHQIELQNTGVMIVLTDNDVSGKLKVTDEQKNSLKEIQEDMRREMGAIFQGGGGGGDFQENMKKMQALGKESRTKAAALLNDEQKKTWKEMTGEPFEVKFEQGQFGQGKGKRKKDKS